MRLLGADMELMGKVGNKTDQSNNGFFASDQRITN